MRVWWIASAWALVHNLTSNLPIKSKACLSDIKMYFKCKRTEEVAYTMRLSNLGWLAFACTILKTKLKLWNYAHCSDLLDSSKTKSNTYLCLYFKGTKTKGKELSILHVWSLIIGGYWPPTVSAQNPAYFTYKKGTSSSLVLNDMAPNVKHWRGQDNNGE